MRRRARVTCASARSSVVNSVKSFIGMVGDSREKCSTKASCATAHRDTQSRSASRASIVSPA